MTRTNRAIATMASLGLAASLVACGQQSADNPETTADSAPAAETSPSIYAIAVASTARPEADRARDASRKPAAVLEFLGIEPGMTVLDMFTGGGYYAEIIAGVAGDDGKVIAQSNQAYLGFVGDEFEERFGSGRLANVEVLMAENNELTLAADSLDAVMLVLSFHDLYFEDAENGWPRIDTAVFLAELKKGLKPGGVLGVIDHYAATDAPRETGDSLHRIDPAIVMAELDAAGFVLDGTSDMLRNPDDKLDVIVFAPEIRGKTDRFVLRYRKPE